MTFSLCEVSLAITAFDLPSQSSSNTSLSKGVNSLVEIVMSLTITGATFLRLGHYVPFFWLSHPIGWIYE
jgi:hypothetical protein